MKRTVAFRLVGVTLLAISTHLVSAGDDALWNDFNEKGLNRLDLEALKEGFKKKGIQLNDEQAKEIIHVADENNYDDIYERAFNNKVVPYFKFRKFDKDGNGHISKDELKGGFKQEGIEINSEREEEIFKVADENHDGKINYREFFDNVFPYFTYDKFDADKSGSITKEELKSGFSAQSITLNEETLEHVFQVGDRNNDGHISYTEFVHRIMKFFIFSEMDSDKSGSINETELKDGFSLHGIYIKEKAKELLDIADLNDDGTVVYREFLHEVDPYFRFVKLENDFNGELTKKGLEKTLIPYGINLDDARLNALIRVGDTNGDDKINYAEYVRKVDAIFVFRRFDKNNNGLLDKTELNDGFALHGLTLDTTQLDALFAVADSIKKDGQIDYEEFVRKTFPYFVFRKFDINKTGSISKDELQKGMKYHGIDLQGDKLTQLYDTANTKSTDEITYDEFVEVIEPYFRFRRFDMSKSGEIGVHELVARVFLYGKKLNREAAISLIEGAEEGTKDGKLSLKEYLKIDSKIV